MQYVCQNSNTNGSKHPASYQKVIKNEYPTYPHGIQSRYQANIRQAPPHPLDPYNSFSYPHTADTAPPPQPIPLFVLSTYTKHPFPTPIYPSLCPLHMHETPLPHPNLCNSSRYLYRADMATEQSRSRHTRNTPPICYYIFNFIISFLSRICALYAPYRAATCTPTVLCN